MFATSFQLGLRSDGRISRLIAAAVLAVSVTALTPTVHAQFGGMGGQGGGGLNSRDMQQYGDILTLDDEQREVVQLLFEEFMQGTQVITSKQRTERERIMEAVRSGDGDWSEMRTIGEKGNKEREDLQEQFLGDVRVILSEDQAQHWPMLERAIRRNQTIRRGFMSGERVDLTKLVPNVELEEDSLASVNGSLGQYEVDLDRALAARNDAQVKAMSQAREVFGSGDQDAIGDLFDKQRKLSVRVRDVNRRYAREIEGMLAGDEQARFTDAFKRASFPQVFRPGRAERVLDLVLRYEDLTEEQKSKVEGIGEVYGRDTSKLNEQQIAAIEDSEESMTVMDMFRQRGGGDGGNRRGGRGGEREQTPQDKIVEKKRELDTKTIESIERALNEGQATKLKDQLDKLRQQEREERQQRGRDGGFRRDR